MVTQDSWRFDSMGIVARNGETELQYHNRAKEIERVYGLYRENFRLQTSISGLFTKLRGIDLKNDRLFQVSDSIPIEECGFENPVMPVVHLDDKIYDMVFPLNSGGVTLPLTIGEEYKSVYSIPIIRASSKGEEEKERKEHEELHTIRNLQEDFASDFNIRKRDIIFNIFYNREAVKTLPTNLYSEMCSYLTGDEPFKKRLEEMAARGNVKIPNNFETNTDSLEFFLNRIIVEKSKKELKLSASTAVGISVTDIVLNDILPGPFLPFVATFYGVRAIGKGCEYYQVRKKSKEFVSTAEKMEDLCRSTGYSFLPTISRLEISEIRGTLDDIKTEGFDEFFEERNKDPTDGFRWEILYKKTKDTKPLQKPEL